MAFEIYSDQKVYEISGDSLEDDSIFEGDYVVVDAKEPVKDGDIVVATVGEEMLLKHFAREKGRQKFYPFCETNPFMYIDNAEIKGKVISLICGVKEHNHASN